MKNFILLLFAFALFSCAIKSVGQSNKKEVKSETLVAKEIEKLSSGFKFTEGPAVDAKGNVYFTDIPNNMILIWTLDNKLDTFSLNSGHANGLYFDKDQNLLACEGEKGQITSTSPDGDYTTIVTEYDGKRFNRPNDLWPDGKGGVYFTDPKYGPDEDEIPQDGMHVYYINPDHTSVIGYVMILKNPMVSLELPVEKSFM